MKRTMMTFVTTAVLAAVVVTMLAGCAGGREKPRPKASKLDGASASPSVIASPDAFGGTSWGLDSSSQTYDVKLGGIYQAVGIEVYESGAVRLVWRAGGDAAEALPVARLKASPGVLEVWLSDLRPHVDLMESLEAESGPVESVAFVAPADDSLMILRLIMRDSSATPNATLEVSAGYGGYGGVIDVVLDD